MPTALPFFAMTTTTTDTALASIRAALGLRRLNPRRLCLIDDGAYRWLADRADLTARRARIFARVTEMARRPDRSTLVARAASRRAAWAYDEVCGSVRNIASTCGSGLVSWDDLPESWRDGSALGPIQPLRRRRRSPAPAPDHGSVGLIVAALSGATTATLARVAAGDREAISLAAYESRIAGNA